jgi:hypothetical protein
VVAQCKFIHNLFGIALLTTPNTRSTSSLLGVFATDPIQLRGLWFAAHHLSNPTGISCVAGSRSSRPSRLELSANGTFGWHLLHAGARDDSHRLFWLQRLFYNLPPRLLRTVMPFRRSGAAALRTYLLLACYRQGWGKRGKSISISTA